MAGIAGGQTGQALTGYIAEARKIWEKLPIRIRLLLMVIAIMTVAGGATMTLMQRVSYRILFTGLSSEDAAAIVTQLKGKKVPYQLGGGGGTISVPEEQVHELRLELAGEGLPSGGGIGFELFDEQRFGMTEFEERVALGRALEGELGRTIGQLQAVKGARVHLVLPKRSLFGKKGSQSQASVVLNLHPGRELGNETISSIVHLVSSSVEGLNPDQVTVVDTRGRLLSQEAGGAMGAKTIEFQQQYEQNLERRLAEMLDRTLGPGASVVRVSANFDFSTKQTTEESYDPERSVLRSEQREVESSGSQTGGAGGVPGARSNLPGGTQPTSGKGSTNSKRETETRNFEVDKVVRQIVGAPATLTRLSVAVMVNGNNASAEPFAPRTPDELQSLEMALRSAMGYDANRGDHIEVLSVPFHVPEEIQAPELRGVPLWKEMLPIGVGVLVAIILALVFLRRSKEQAVVATPVASLPLPRPVRELEAMVGNAGNVPAPVGSDALAGPETPQTTPAMMMGQVRQYFMDETEGTSRVLKSWLSEARQQQEAGERTHEAG